MEFEIKPDAFRAGLKKLMPNARKRSLLRQGPGVLIVATAGRLELVGDFDNSAELNASVRRPGACRVDLQMLLNVLGKYPKSEPMRFTCDGDALRFAAMSIRLKSDSP